MQLEQSFTLPFSRAVVWPVFADEPMLVACMPGAALQGAPQPMENGADIDLLFTVKLGPITGAFLGSGVVRRDDAAWRGTFSGSGADRKSGSRAKGEATFALIELDAASTRVDVNVEYSLTGPLAQFSRGAIVKELAAALTRDFATNLRERIAASPFLSAAAAAMPLAPAPAETHTEAHTQTHTEAAPLDAWRLFWPILWARIRGWFGRAHP